MNADERGLEPYRPIPVDEARAIADRYRKRMVVILAYDGAHEKTHVTTYGVAAEDKVNAAAVGDRCAAVVGADLAQKQSHEDFRAIEASQWAERVDRLLRACRAAVEGIDSIEVLDDASHNVVEGMQRNLQEAIEFGSKPLTPNERSRR